MSSPSPLQCLFCNHLNPGGASFCNDCGSQLHLQQCDLCGSINKRAARACYKCGAAFIFSAAHGAQPSILENKLECSAFDYGEIEHEVSVLPGTAAQALSAAQKELKSEAQKSVTYSGPVDTRANVLETHLPVHAPIEAFAADESDLSEAPATQSRSQFLYPAMASAMLLAAIVMSVCVYQGFFRQTTPEPGADKINPVASGDPVLLGAARSLSTASVEIPPVQSGTMKKFSFRVLGGESEAAPSVGATATKKRPLPATDGEAIQDRSGLNECQQAVAALGLCGAVPIQERP